ncbi:P-loop containing nucleoside triphosphate hydrolase protein [Triangularia verruculosa]|uniref:P-loop containing nucleoside triphosphate hydrolase protein n=1 Tax=Triangularia verruculosa TaxID=2587418 RepID=A0AAN7ATX9_9PEZI|nr:P-loop containing nucleoside triphosphate hydrolase protein [Triangularia verruculosa]
MADSEMEYESRDPGSFVGDESEMDDDSGSDAASPALFDFSDAFGAGTARPHREGTGLSCQLKSYDSLYNATGYRQLLQTGSSASLEDDRYAHSFKAALIVTRFFKRDRSIEYTELQIRSPHMKAAIKSVIPAYRTLDIVAQHIVLRDESQCIFHFRNKLMAYGNSTQDQRASRHISFLIQYVYGSLASSILSFIALMENPALVPSFDFLNLWMVFRPGDLVYIKGSSQKRIGHGCVYRFVKMERCKCEVRFCSKSKWDLTLEGINYDGTAFGYMTTFISISPFDGNRQIRDLVAFPLKYHPEEQSLRQRLLLRGAKFAQLHGQHYRQYSGIASMFGFDHNSRSGKDIMVEGRIMVDADAFDQALPFRSPTLIQSKQKFNPDDAHTSMTEEDYLICSDEIAGYSLNERKWGFFKVDLIQEVEFDDDAFEQLMIDERAKRQLLSLVRVHENETLHFDDFIKGKGKGMIFLLHGDPGVGKTLAAESIADVCKKPLLRVDASAFGTKAESVETSLAEALKNAERWQAVALLDEADVFLEQRRNNELERNNVVSVFLRSLEYYKGILFLTTNRIGVFDKAFKSRIHLAIHFPPLSFDIRLSLWDAFISKASSESAQVLGRSGSLTQLAMEELNGRQIKNIVRTAFALAVSEGTTIQLEHITMALDAMKAFEDDFDASQRQNRSERTSKQTKRRLEEGRDVDEEPLDSEGSICGDFLGKRPRLHF